MICQKCKKDFQEREIEISHNIPKYIGGTDSEGRNALCSKCHEEYEFLVLSQIYKTFFARIIEKKEDRREYIPLMNYLKKQDEHTKSRFVALIKVFREEEYEAA
jgi:hypothetical protein